MTLTEHCVLIEQSVVDLPLTVACTVCVWQAGNDNALNETE